MAAQATWLAWRVARQAVIAPVWNRLQRRVDLVIHPGGPDIVLWQADWIYGTILIDGFRKSQFEEPIRELRRWKTAMANFDKKSGRREFHRESWRLCWRFADRLQANFESTAMRGKVLIVVGDASETLDTMYPYYRLQESGFTPVVAAPEKRLYQMVMHEVKPGWTITKEWEGYTIQADVAFADIRPEDYAGIMFSGGRAPEYIRYDEDLVRVTKHFFAEGKPIASVCHGVEIPAYADCVRGRRMATVAKCKFDLEVCGGEFVDEPCVVDGNLISGRTFHDNGHYLGPWIQLLLDATS